MLLLLLLVVVVVVVMMLVTTGGAASGGCRNIGMIVDKAEYEVRTAPEGEESSRKGSGAGEGERVVEAAVFEGDSYANAQIAALDPS